MDPAALLQVGSAVAVNAGLALLIGSVLARWWLLDAGDGARGLAGRLRATELAAAGVAFIGQCGAMWAAAAVMTGGSLAQASSMLVMMLTETAYGQAGLAGLALLAGVMAAASLRGQSPARCLGLLVALALFALARASVSHGGEGGMLTLGLAVEWIHLILIAFWVGGVAAAGWLVLPAARDASWRSGAFNRYLERLSLAATIALAGIVVTGADNAWYRLGALRHLVDTGYGTTLIVKVCFVAGAIALGGYNKLNGFPALTKDARASGRVTMILRIESILLLCALIAAAVLTSQQPPAAV
jgi:putative copper resistance protein D